MTDMQTRFRDLHNQLTKAGIDPTTDFKESAIKKMLLYVTGLKPEVKPTCAKEAGCSGSSATPTN